MATRAQRLNKVETEIKALTRAKLAQSRVVRQKLQVYRAKRKIADAAGSEYTRANNKIWAFTNQINRKRDQINNIKKEAERKRLAELARKCQDHKTKELNKTPWYKWIRPTGQAPIAGGSFRYSMPKTGTPGNWHVQKNGVSMCNRGFHVTKPSNVSYWKPRDCNLYLVEVAGAARHDSEKSVFSKIRVIRKVTENEKAKLMSGQAI